VEDHSAKTIKQKRAYSHTAIFLGRTTKRKTAAMTSQATFAKAACPNTKSKKFLFMLWGCASASVAYQPQHAAF
jgi:hypothetical protein